MTDSRLPGRWLTDPVMDNLSDPAWRAFTGSLMWSNEAGTDGDVPARQMRLIHPQGSPPKRVVDELVAAGLWERTSSGVQVLDWQGNGQELASVVEEKRRVNRERQRKRRRIQKEASPTAVTRDVTRDVGQDVGQERTGTVTGTGTGTGTGTAQQFTANERHHDDASAVNWETVPIPGQEGWHQTSESGA